MNKRVTIILIVLFIAVSLPTSATAQIVTVEFSKMKDEATGQMIHHLVYKRGEKIIAKRSYSPVDLTACRERVFRKSPANSAPIRAAAHFHVRQGN